MATRKDIVDVPAGAKKKLMVCAERLFGQHGLDGVSLRQITEAAGQANNSIIHYYFGSKQGLVQAVHDMRAPVLEAARRGHLDRIGAKGSGTLRQYVEALHMSVIEALSKTDRLNYAKFVLRLLPLGKTSHPYFRSIALSTATEEIISGIQAQCPRVSPEITMIRLRMATNLFLNLIIDFPRVMRNTGKPFASEEAYWQDCFQILIAMFQCPCPPGHD
jgi:AcrR family transcriptional regulator